MRKVFLDELPKDNRGRIKWIETVGHRVKFIYDDIEGEVIIISYNKKGSIVGVKYENNELKIKSCHLLGCNIGRLLKTYSGDFKFKVGQIIKDEKRDFIITSREYIDKTRKNGRIEKKKYYKYTCNICRCKELNIEESNLINGKNCPVCANKIAVLGINTMWDTDHWMCDLGVSEEDAKTHTRGSSDKIKVVCPNCEKEKHIKICEIYKNKSISCNCGDGFSYSEKFMVSVFNQLGINFETQLTKTTFDWCSEYKYDFYIPSLNMIAETHGIQHYQYTGFGRTLEEEQKNDRIKKELALSNGVDKYVVIDCRHSDVEWVKNSILSSELVKLFDLSKIDWLKCEEFALSNLVKEVCDYWNNKEDCETTVDVAKIFNISDNTVREYLYRGNELGWCKYDPYYENKKKYNYLKNKLGKSVEILKNNKILYTFISTKELERQSEEKFGVRLDARRISEVCNGKKSQYKGFTFKYTENIE